MPTQLDQPRPRTALRARSWTDAAVPLTGPLAVVAMVVAGELYGPSAAGANPTQASERVLQFFAQGIENARSSAALQLVAALAFVVFAGALWDRLRRAEGAAWAAVTAAAGAVLAAMYTLDFARDTLAAVVAVDAHDEITVSVLITTGWESARLAMPGAAAMMLGAGVAGLHGALPRWFAWLSLAGGLAALASTVVSALPTAFGAGAPAGMVALVSLAWCLPAGVVLAVTDARPADGR